MKPLLPLAFAWLVSAAPGGGDGKLDEAKKLLAENAEESCRKGTEQCVAANNVEAVELLLDVLRQEADRGLPVAHYRDVVWGGLSEISDAAGRARVQTELEKNKKDPQVREWCADLLGEYGELRFALVLADACEDQDLGVRRAATFALGKLRFADAKSADVAAIGAALTKKTLDKDPLLRANAYEALLRSDHERKDADPRKQAEVLDAGLKDKDAGVRCVVLGVAGELFPDQAEARAAAALKDPDWRPRMQAVDVLGDIKTPHALRLLIDALSDARPAVVARATHDLQELTGEKQTRKEAWEDWWKQKGDGFDFSQGRHKEARTTDGTSSGTFNGILFESDHTAFLIDSSRDMASQLKSQHCTKAEAALKELESTLARQRGHMRFSLFTYAREITPFAKKGPVELDAKSQERALAFVKDQKLEGSKDIWQALETVLADADIDTVFLLSSGEPEVGEYVHWNRTAWHLAQLNRLHKVVVHAIAYSDNQWYRDQLEHISAVTGGEFKYFE